MTWLGEHDSPWFLPLLGVAVLVEYVFPPFPGDAIVLGASALVLTGRWSAASVLVPVILGSVAGTAIDYYAGVWLSHGRAGWRDGAAPLRPNRIITEQRYLWLAVKLRRYGVWLILFNRFLPGVRALIFVAAGIARLPVVTVLLLAMVAAALHAGLLLAVGVGIGANWVALREAYDRFTAGVWLVLGAAALAWLATWLWRRRRGRSG